VKSIISATYIFLDLTNKDKRICILSIIEMILNDLYNFIQFRLFP